MKNAWFQVRAIGNSDSGQGVIGALIVATALVSTLIVVVATRSDGQSRIREQLQLQLGAITMMEDLAVIVRRSFDQSETRRVLGQATPGPCSTSADPAGGVALQSGAEGMTSTRRLCIPPGEKSCVRHPLDRSDMNAEPSLPLICLDTQTPIGPERSAVSVSFRLNKPNLRQWAQLRAFEFRHGPIAAKFNEVLNAGVLLGTAHASTSPPRPHLPDLSGRVSRINELSFLIDQPALGAGVNLAPFFPLGAVASHQASSLGDYYRRCRTQPPAMANAESYPSTGDANRDAERSVCYTITVCLQASGCSEPELAFRQTIALTR
jgi:hypothetical protein